MCVLTRFVDFLLLDCWCFLCVLLISSIVVLFLFAFFFCGVWFVFVFCSSVTFVLCCSHCLDKGIIRFHVVLFVMCVLCLCAF